MSKGNVSEPLSSRYKTGETVPLLRSIIVPGGVGVTQLADFEDHLFHVVAVGANLEFTHLSNKLGLRWVSLCSAQYLKRRIKVF